VLEILLVEHLVIGIALWVAIYISDYYLTIYGAAIYRAHIKEFLELEGSYELTPQFQDDIDKLRKLSPQFIHALSISTLALILVWYAAVWVSRLWYFNIDWVYIFFFGALFMREVMVHMRHFDILFRYRLIRERGGLEGHLMQKRWLTYEISYRQILTYSGLFLVFFLFTGSFLFAGGSLSTLITGLQHRTLAKKETLG